MAVPLDRQIDDWADRLEKAAMLLRSDKRRLQGLIERDRHGLTPDGMPSGGGEGRTRGGDHSDPVLSAVLSLTDDEDRTAEQKAHARRNADYIHKCADGALRAAEAAAVAAGTLVGLVREGERIEDKAKTRPGAAVCAEQKCEAEAMPGRQGRCEPCYRWRYRWRQENPTQSVPPVPAEVIDARKIAKRRMYEDGRMVG